MTSTESPIVTSMKVRVHHRDRQGGALAPPIHLPKCALTFDLLLCTSESSNSTFLAGYRDRDFMLLLTRPQPWHEATSWHRWYAYSNALALR